MNDSTNAPTALNPAQQFFKEYTAHLRSDAAAARAFFDERAVYGVVVIAVENVVHTFRINPDDHTLLHDVRVEASAARLFKQNQAAMP